MYIYINKRIVSFLKCSNEIIQLFSLVFLFPGQVSKKNFHFTGHLLKLCEIDSCSEFYIYWSGLNLFGVFFL